MKAFSLAAAVLLLCGGASAQIALPRPSLLPPDSTAPVPEVRGVAVDEDGVPLSPEEQRTNFLYGEISNRLKKTIIGRGRHKRRVNNGVTPADRVERGEIKYIVVHSAMGPCEGAINTMEKHHAAAHFMVCEGGSVTRLVAIKDIALHVKNKEINAASVGIETETGYNDGTEKFALADWDPDTRWRMYASLAWLIRAVAEEAGVPRDERHIIGHYDADLGIPRAHTDPGPMYYGQSYPAFDKRFPGQGVTPKTFLMMLVRDDAPPVVERAPAASGEVLRVREANKTGVGRVKLFRLGGKKPEPVTEWVAGARGFPPDSVDLPFPTEPGDYRVEAFDLVGNMTRARFTVAPAGQGGLRATAVEQY